MKRRTEREYAERRTREHLKRMGYSLYRQRSPSRIDFIAIRKGGPVVLVRVNPKASDRAQLALLARSVRARALLVVAKRGRSLAPEFLC